MSEPNFNVFPAATARQSAWIVFPQNFAPPCFGVNRTNGSFEAQAGASYACICKNSARAMVQTSRRRIRVARCAKFLEVEFFCELVRRDTLLIPAWRWTKRGPVQPDCCLLGTCIADVSLTATSCTHHQAIRDVVYLRFVGILNITTQLYAMSNATF